MIHRAGDEDQPARGRIAQALHDDVEEAREIAPLIVDAKAVPEALRSRIWRFLPLLLLFGTGAVVLISGGYRQLDAAHLAANNAWLAGWANLHPLLAALSLVGALVVVVATGLPGSSLLAVAGGLYFGLVEGALLASLGETLGATVLYVAARRMFDGSGRGAPALVERIRAGYQRSPLGFTLFLRLVPVFPYGPVSVALAWLGCRWPMFLGCTAFGSLAAAAIYAGIGSGLGASIAQHQALSMHALVEPRFLVPLAALGVLALLPALFGLRRKPGGA